LEDERGHIGESKILGTDQSDEVHASAAYQGLYNKPELEGSIPNTHKQAIDEIQNEGPNSQIAHEPQTIQPEIYELQVCSSTNESQLGSMRRPAMPEQGASTEALEQELRNVREEQERLARMGELRRREEELLRQLTAS
jgi:hypothetical protein